MAGTFLIAGITGHVGGAAAQALLDAGHTVRALVRTPAKAAAWKRKGVELVEGELTNATAVASALEGTSGAFFLVPPNVSPQPGYPESKAVIDSYAAAVKKAPPAKLVLLSSVGSEQESGLGLITATHMLEQALGDSPFPIAIVRAGSFVENAVGALDTAASTGIYYSFYQPVDRPVPHIASHDIGVEVAKLLMYPWNGKRIIELGSPATPNDIACAMGEVLGREVVAQAVPRDHWAGVLQGFGLPEGGTWAYEEMLDSVNSGHIHFGVQGTECVPATTKAAAVFRAARSV